MEKIKWQFNNLPKDGCKNLSIMQVNNVEKARAFHKSFPQYTETPLANLKNLSSLLGISSLFVKDESYRFGLNAFKVLGGSFAIANFLAQKMGCDVSEITYDKITSDKFREEFGQATFYTATDGNHGRGVAWTANKLKQKSVVILPKGTAQTRLDNVLKEGAQSKIEDVNYDECVRIAVKAAEKDPFSVVIQDTAWGDYQEIPSWIMQGYGTMALEACEQMKSLNCSKPTHVFVQAGVGSLAGAIQGFLSNLYKEDCPTVVVVEASKAACIYKSALAGDGSIKFVEGDMPTIMAGLACGEPNEISWNILKNKTDCFVSCPDWVAALGMRILAAPIKGDPQVISGESGAVTAGLVYSIMTDPSLSELKNSLKLDENSNILLFSTEGDTDPINYKNIVWHGKTIED